MHALGADGVSSLRVFPEKGPVDALIRHLDRAHIGKQVERLAHRNVRALDIRPRVARLGGRGRALEDHVAFFKLLEHVVRDGLVGGHAVFDRQAVDHLEFYFTGLYVIREHVFQPAGRFLGDDRADAVAAAHADDDFIKFAVINKVFFRLDAVRALVLLAHKRFKVRHSGLNFCFVHLSSLHRLI